MAIDEVENWEIVAKDNPAPLPAGPPGAKQKRIALSFTEIMASIARWRDSIPRESISVKGFGAKADSGITDNIAAFDAAITYIKSPVTTARTLIIPSSADSADYYGLGSTWLIDTGNIRIEVYGDIKLTSTDRQKTIEISYDGAEAPAQVLENIQFIGNATITGNGAAMTFDYSHGDASSNDSTVRFNRIKNLYVIGIHFTDGPIDSMSLRACQHYLIDHCEFSFAKEDNGFSTTTDFATYVQGDFSTYAYGTISNSVAHHNKDFGMTAFNASGVRFEFDDSYENEYGFSHEPSTTSKAASADSGFYGSKAYENRNWGFYIESNGVTVDDECESYNNRGTALDNSSNIYEHGVLVSKADDIYIGGNHRKNGRSGVAILNGDASAMNITIGADCEDNDYHGLWGRGISSLTIKDGSKFDRNGTVLIDSAYGDAIHVSNSGGANYHQGAGKFTVQGAIIRENGRKAFLSDYVVDVDFSHNRGEDNCQDSATSACYIDHAGSLLLRENEMKDSVPNATFAYHIDTNVITAIEYGNKGDFATGRIANSATNKLGLGRPEDSVFTLGTYSPTYTIADTASASAANNNAVLSTILKHLQESGIIRR